MLLQRQYSLWKLANNLLVWLIFVLILWATFLNWRASSLENSIKEKQAELVKLTNELTKLENTGFLKKFRIASVIQKKENSINYYGFYKYLNSIKEDLEKMLKTEWNITYNRFKLKIEKDKVKISLMVPSYNSLYSSNSFLFDNISKKDFIKKVSINNYKTKWMNTKFVYFDMTLFTK